MADATCNDVCLWVKHVGGRDIRTILLSLEPGSQIWLSIDGDAVQFERMQDGADGRSTRGFKPIGSTASAWLDKYVPGQSTYIEEIEVIERPSDAGAAGSGFYQRPIVGEVSGEHANG